MTSYYNEFDAGAAAWLRELIKRGLIADGEVDERSILDVRPVDLRGFTQCHFFAGIGGWSYALRLAGWPDDRPVWTGSPPCQPFSTAGRNLGRDDARHLAPHFVDLVRSCRPPVLFGEQVASAAVFGGAAKGGRNAVAGTPEWAWFDDLSDRLEAAHYAVGASDIPAAGVGALHIRQRTFFGAVRMADIECARLEGYGRSGRVDDAQGREVAVGLCASGGVDGGLGNSERVVSERRPGEAPCAEDRSWCVEEPSADRSVDAGAGAGGLADADSGECHGVADGQGCIDNGAQAGWVEGHGQPECSGAGERVADTSGDGRIEGCADAGRLRSGDGAEGLSGRSAVNGGVERVGRSSTVHGGWASADWLFCRDGKWRAVEPGTFPLVDGVSARVGRLRGYGNAIGPQAAAVFIEAFSEVIGLNRGF